MKANEFDLEKDLRLSLDTGVATFRNTRLVILDASSLGLLRATVVQEIGKERARQLFLRFGFTNGYGDFGQMKKKYTFDSEIELLASGPIIHTWEGIVKATPSAIRFDREKRDFHFTGVWSNSWEAEQHLCHFATETEPVCWTLMGYASGWCTAFFGSPLLAIEPTCAGKGDANCGWLIQPPDRFGPEAAPYVEALKPLWGE